MNDHPNLRRPYARRLAPALRPILLVLLCSALLAPAAHAGVELEARYWAPELASRVGVDGAAFDPALEFDGPLDLGLDTDEDFEARLLLSTGWGFFLRAAYQNLSSSGATSLDVGVVGLPFDVTADLDTGLDFEYGRLALGWRYTNPGDTLSFGIFAEAKAVRGDVSVTASAFDISAGVSDDFEAAVPAAGAILRLRPGGGKLEIFAEASVAVDTDEADVTDAELGARYFLTETFGVGAGYRTLEIDAAFDSVRVDYDLDGAFVTAVLRF